MVGSRLLLHAKVSLVTLANDMAAIFLINCSFVLITVIIEKCQKFQSLFLQGLKGS